MNKQKIIFHELGLMDYQLAWDYQEALLGQNVQVKSANWGQAGKSDLLTTDASLTVNHLLLVEHPPVYTLGKSGRMENVLISEQERTDRKIGFYKINRGGDITFHGPGQIVAYPILDLENFYTDIGRYMRDLEEVVIKTCSDYGIAAGRSPGETGVWVDAGIRGRERKICAIGVRCSRWITMHGFAFNVNTDLNYFRHIIPCGIQDKQVTSLQKETSSLIDIEKVKQKVLGYFEEVFNAELVKNPAE